MSSIAMEPINVESRLSGSAIIDDLCNRIAERLACNGDLREVDSYRGYSARVTVELKLQDVDTVEARTEVIVGPPLAPPKPAALPGGHIALDVKVTPEELAPAPSLERNVDGSLPEAHSATPKPPKRYYTPRGSVPGTRRS